MADLSRTKSDLPSRLLIVFYLLTFAITWSIGGLYLFAPQWAVARFGDISGAHPFFFLGTWAPGISALVLVLFYGGVGGLKRFLGRLFWWRGSPYWAAFILLGVPAVYVAGSWMKGGGMLAPLPSQGIGAGIAILFMMLFLGPVEEFGWRGVAQPILQRHLAPLWAGVVIGLFWGLWHLPAFFLTNTVFASWSFFPFLIGNIVLAVLVTPIFNAARGSLLWPMLFHWQLINPFWPDAQPYDTWILLAIAVLVVWWNRETMLKRGEAVTEVMPQAKGVVQ
ncbi:MAG: CPBP family intramembrane metalloprotease [Rhodobacterales bacterium]|nr:MAG: CPBP family intramembrane metalloprotease [Rhodobacterales bacterium]